MIVFFTDFGWEGTYVGQMEAVVRSLCPQVPIVHLCHTVHPQDVVEGAFLLTHSYEVFPPGTVFVAVVDPGVGTERVAMAVETPSYTFFAPDNGLLTGILLKNPPSRVVQLTNPQYHRPVVSSTFHGRDIFAPCSAYYLRGVPLTAFGPLYSPQVFLKELKPEVSPTCIRSQVVHIDRFGNLVTPISRDLLYQWLRGKPYTALEITLGSLHLQGLHKTYGEVPWGEPLALLGSFDTLEIAINGGNASQSLGVKRGEEVRITLKET